MSYTVLARRYRSRTFDEVIGQEHVAQTLKKAIASGRIAHAYLFCGTRGTGKTSTARILAKALNCQKGDGPTTEPCGECDSCQAIARGEDIDVIEIDAASNTGVDNVREIIENSQYRPARSRFKIYIIDEVHMLSKNAFNALLKTLEEPPAHVKFILATTEPEKVLATILSRCQRYDFRNIPTRQIAGHLKSICEKEHVQADDDALLLIAKAGAGSMRDALSLLDRLLSLGEGQLTVEMIEQLLGLPRSQQVYELVQAIGQADVRQTLMRADAMIQSGLSVDSFIASLVDHLHNLLILRACGRDSELVEVPGLSLDDLAQQAGAFDPVTLTQDITILEELRRTLRQTQAGRALLDATLVRLALSDQFTSIGELLGRVEGSGGATAAQKKKPEGVAGSTQTSQVAVRPAPPGVGAADRMRAVEAPRAEAPPAPAAPPVPAAPPQEPAPAQGEVAVDLDEDDDLPRPGKVWEEDSGPSLAELLKLRSGGATSTAAGSPPPASAPAAETASSAPAPAPAAADAAAASSSAAGPVDAEDRDAVWQQVLEALQSQGPALMAILSTARYAAVIDEAAIVQFPPQNATFVKMMERNGKKDLVRDAFCAVLGRPIAVRFEAMPEEESSAPAPVTAVEPIAPAAPAAAAPPIRREPSARREAASAPAPVAEMPTTVRLTPEQRQELENHPLVRAVMLELGGNIVRFE